MGCALYAHAPDCGSPVALAGSFCANLLAASSLCRIVIFVPGFAIQMRALHLLRRGVRKEFWREEDLDALRTQVNRPVWTIISSLLLASSMLLMLVSPVRPTFSAAWWFLWWPAYLLMDLRLVLRKPISSVRTTIDWSNAKPVRFGPLGSSSLTRDTAQSFAHKAARTLPGHRFP